MGLENRLPPDSILERIETALATALELVETTMEASVEATDLSVALDTGRREIRRMRGLPSEQVTPTMPLPEPASLVGLGDGWRAVGEELPDPGDDTLVDVFISGGDRGSDRCMAYLDAEEVWRGAETECDLREQYPGSVVTHWRFLAAGPGLSSVGAADPCEGCGRPSTKRDTEDVPLCDDCYDAAPHAAICRCEECVSDTRPEYAEPCEGFALGAMVPHAATCRCPTCAAPARAGGEE